MKKFFLTTLLATVLAFAGAGIVVAQDPPVAAEEPAALDSPEGVEVSEEVAGTEAGETILVTEDQSVTFPIGQWIAAISDMAVNILWPFVVGAIGVATGFLTKYVGNIVTTARVEQLTRRALDYGVATTVGAVKDKTVTFNVGNAVVAKALRYAIEHAPSVVKKAGGEKKFTEKLIARTPFDETAGTA